MVEMKFRGQGWLPQTADYFEDIEVEVVVNEAYAPYIISLMRDQDLDLTWKSWVD